VRFREVFRYELAYRVRSASTWLYAGFLFLIAFWIVHVGATGGAEIKVNAPQRVAETAALFCGLFGLLVTAALVSDAAIRDRTVGMDSLLFTTRLRPPEYLGGRFLAALATNGILVLAIPIGLAVGSLMPYLEREQFGPNHFAAYLQPVLLFLLPNLVLTGAILFTIAALTRKAIPVYLGAIAIFIGYIVAANYWSGIANPMLSVLADPLGINALKGMTEYWTASERNTRFVGFPPMLLWNRLLWLAIAAALLGVLQRTFRFVQRDERGRGAVTVDAPGEERSTDAVPPVEGVFGPRTRVRQTLAVMRQSLAEVMSGRAFQVAFVAAIGLVLLWGWNVGNTLYETITLPVTHLVAGVVLAQRAIIIPWLVIIVYAGELVWKDRETGAAAIADAVPVRTGVALLGRFLALVAIIGFFQFAFMIGGILLQVLQGYYQFEPVLYVRILGLSFVEHVLLAAFAMTVHVLVNHKYLGHVVALLATIFNKAALYGVHHLFIYNSGPERTYSEMNGFGSVMEAFVWFKLYWAAWALLFAVAIVLFWVRGPELGMRQRFVIARARFTGRIARVAALAIAAILMLGGFIFYNTNVLNEYLPPQEAGRPQAEYERRYSRYENLPQPVIAGANLRFEIYPGKYALDMRGSYALVNRTGVPIDSVHVETPSGRNYVVRSMTFDRGAKATVVDREHGYRIFALERPIAPGESVRFSFDVALHQRGFPHGGWLTNVVHNGSYFDRRLLPFIGYQPGFEVSGDSARKRFGLPPQPPMPDARDAQARRYNSRFRDGDRILVETIVGTAPDQTAVVPAMLRRSWTENGRRYFHYASRVPETFGTAVFSAKYAVYEGRWNDVSLQIFHHPPHRHNRDRMMAAMKAALDYYTSTFGPYPYRELRVVEIPPYSIFGRAFPSAAAFSEANFITRVEPGLVDLTFFGTAHEIAHQWWGGQVRPAYAKGRAFVSEALSNYSAMLVTEKALGPAEARRVYDYQMNRYLTQRGEFGRDAPLLEVDDHPYVSYGKGAVALYTLREHIGDQAMNTALRRFLEKYRGSGPPYATSLDLYAELRAVTPPSLHSLLHDLFETITLWVVKTKSATARRLADGQYEVTLDVVAQKVRADSLGAETPTPMNDFVEVGVFAPGKDDPFYLKRHRLHSGRQTLRIVVPQEPSRAGLDPYRKLIERERDDNVVAVDPVTP
jgi:ABC-type transport system involved in multi-copper enzyme maturation permease subunit